MIKKSVSPCWDTSVNATFCLVNSSSYDIEMNVPCTHEQWLTSGKILQIESHGNGTQTQWVRQTAEHLNKPDNLCNMFLSAAFSICGFLEAAFVWSLILYSLLIVIRKEPNISVKGKGKAVILNIP